MGLRGAPSVNITTVYISLKALLQFFLSFNFLFFLLFKMQLHSPTNLLLLSLAVSDFIMGLLVMPVEILMMWTCWVLGDLLCALYYFLPVTLLNSSVGNMVLISVDRYVAICDPMHYPTRVTVTTVSISVCLCWICSFLYSCIMNFTSADVNLFVSFVIPVTLMVVLYMRVFVVAVSQSELKAAGTLGVVVAVFLLCYCPYYGLCLTGSNILNGSVLESFMSFVLFSNSGLNPLLYALFYPWFRKSFKNIMTLQILQPGSRDTNILWKDSAQ
uniref:G-protein coupled receptors family 1 profile domain-containing protein n=1 Tax=Monopterus albus TaxID=43700 RepID=A0A3Q3K900_MONAL